MPAAAAADPATPPSAIPPSEALLGRTARPLQQRAVGKRSKKAPPLCLPLLALMAGISCWSFGRWLSSSPAPLTTPSTDKRACARWRQKPNHLVLAAGPTGSLEAARASRDAERRRRAAAAATSALKQAEDFLSRRGKSTIRLDATLRGLQDGRCIGGPELAPRFAAAHERLIQLRLRAQPSSSGAASAAVSPAQRARSRASSSIMRSFSNTSAASPSSASVPSAAAAAAAAAAAHNGPRVRNSTRTHQSRRLR